MFLTPNSLANSPKNEEQVRELHVGNRFLAAHYLTLIRGTSDSNFFRKGREQICQNSMRKTQLYLLVTKGIKPFYIKSWWHKITSKEDKCVELTIIVNVTSRVHMPCMGLMDGWGHTWGVLVHMSFTQKWKGYTWWIFLSGKNTITIAKYSSNILLSMITIHLSLSGLHTVVGTLYLAFCSVSLSCTKYQSWFSFLSVNGLFVF